MKTVAIIILSALISAIIAQLIINKIRKSKNKGKLSDNKVEIEVPSLKITKRVDQKHDAIRLQKFDGRIINERPSNWTFIQYREYLLEQKIWLKYRLKGRLVYMSSEIVTPTINDKGESIPYTRRYKPFAGNTEKLKFI